MAKPTDFTPQKPAVLSTMHSKGGKLLLGLCLASFTASFTFASESILTKEELYTPLVNAYESDLLEKRAALSKCVTTACAVYTQLDITRLNSKLAEIKAIYAHMIEAETRLEACPQTHVTRCISPEKALINSLSNEIYAAKEGK